MSVINRVLKDLDGQGGTPNLPGGVQVVRSPLVSPRRVWPWLLLPLLAAALWWGWPRQEIQAPVLPSVLPPSLPAPAAAPQLRMSEDLTVPAPSRGAETATPSFPRPEPTAPAMDRVALRDKVTAPPSAIKLDTRLPELRPAKVIKEPKPLSPAEQAEALWRQAARSIEQGRAREALEPLVAALKLEPGHAAARQSLVALYLETGDAARGEALLREGLELHPQDPWYNRSLAQAVLQRGDAVQAAALLKAGLGKGVDGAYWGLYAGVLNKAGQAAESIPAWREAARLNPQHGPWWIGLAVALDQAGQRQDAATAYQQALRTRLSAELREFAIRRAQE